MIDQSSNYALLQELNNQVSNIEITPRPQPTSRVQTAESRRSRPRSRKKRVEPKNLHPPWKANDKKPQDTRRNNYTENENFITTRPRSSSRSRPVSAKVNTNLKRPPSRSKQQKADMMTKPLDRILFEHVRRLVMGW